jgi:hypothetical protein
VVVVEQAEKVIPNRDRWKKEKKYSWCKVSKDKATTHLIHLVEDIKIGLI